MTKVGFLGFGKIGHAVAERVKETGNEVVFVADPMLSPGDAGGIPVFASILDAPLGDVDLVVECATRFALADGFDAIIENADLLVFSLTAFSDEAFLAHVRESAERLGRTVYIPHGAILGIDGIADGSSIIESVSITTTKSPQSLGLNPEEYTEPTVVFAGSTRDACSAFPRNVNVHAACALAGIGFDRTESRIVADPAVSTNAHVICVKGEGIEFEIHVSSFSSGGVTGVYTPVSACGSITRVLGGAKGFSFV